MVVSTTGRFLCNDNTDKLEDPLSEEDNEMEIPRLQIRAMKIQTMFEP